MCLYQISNTKQRKSCQSLINVVYCLYSYFIHIHNTFSLDVIIVSANADNYCIFESRYNIVVRVTVTVTVMLTYSQSLNA